MQVVDAVDGDLFPEVLKLSTAHLNSFKALLMNPPTTLNNLGGKYLDFQTLS